MWIALQYICRINVVIAIVNWDFHGLIVPCVQLASDKLGELIVAPLYNVVRRYSQSLYGAKFGGSRHRLPLFRMLPTETGPLKGP